MMLQRNLQGQGHRLALAAMAVAAFLLTQSDAAAAVAARAVEGLPATRQASRGERMLLGGRVDDYDETLREPDMLLPRALRRGKKGGRRGGGGRGRGRGGGKDTTTECTLPTLREVKDNLVAARATCELKCAPSTLAPTAQPTNAPSNAPTSRPSDDYSSADYNVDDYSSEDVSSHPIANPTFKPTTDAPSSAPTETPSSAPTETPSSAPTETPSSAPTETPSSAPTETLSSTPTKTPSSAPVATPNPTQITGAPVATPNPTQITDAPVATPIPAAVTEAPVSSQTPPSPTPSESPTSTPTTGNGPPPGGGGVIQNPEGDRRVLLEEKGSNLIGWLFRDTAKRRRQCIKAAARAIFENVLTECLASCTTGSRRQLKGGRRRGGNRGGGRSTNGWKCVAQCKKENRPSPEELHTAYEAAGCVPSQCTVDCVEDQYEAFLADHDCKE